MKISSIRWLSKITKINKSGNDTNPRLVFELEYLESLPTYKPIKPNIFNSFRDTVLGSVVEISE